MEVQTSETRGPDNSPQTLNLGSNIKMESSITLTPHPLLLLFIHWQRVVSGAEALPFIVRLHSSASLIEARSHDGGETGLHVPEDVAVEEPGA